MSTHIPDDEILRAMSDATFRDFLANLAATTMYIYAKEAGKPTPDGGRDYTAVDTVVGTGPFMLEDWKVEQQMVLKKNPSYFRKGLPYVDQLTLRIIPDEANIVAALRTGQIHHAFIEDNKNFNLLKEEKTLTGYRSSRLGYDFLNINASRGPLKDVRVRQAISWTIDRSQVMRVAASGFGRIQREAFGTESGKEIGA